MVSRYRNKILHRGQARFNSDGLNSLKYNLRWLQQKKLYTWVMVDIDENSVRRGTQIVKVKPNIPAEGHGNEARRRMKEKEELLMSLKQNKTDITELRDIDNNMNNRFDADVEDIIDEGEEIKGGVTFVNGDDLRTIKMNENNPGEEEYPSN